MTDRTHPSAAEPEATSVAALFIDVHHAAVAAAAEISDAEIEHRIARLLAEPDARPVDGPGDPGEDEAVPLPRTVHRPGRPSRRRPSSWQRRALPAGIAAAAAAVVVLVTVLARSGDPGMVEPARTPTHSPSAVATARACSATPPTTPSPSTTRKPENDLSFVGEVVYAPDGRSIVSVSAGPDRVWDASTGTVRRAIADGGHGMAMSAAFSPDGGVLVLGRLDGSVTVQDAVTGSPLCTFTGHRDAVDGAAFSPDGRTLATASLDGTARIWDAASGRTLHELTGSGAALRAVAYSPDGALLATVAGDGATTLWDVASGQRRRVLSSPVSPTDQMTYVVAFAPDGRTVVRGGDSGGVVVWDLSATGGQRVVQDAGPVYGLAFSPDGDVLVYTTADDTVHLVDPSTGDQLRSFTAGSSTTVDGVAFSPDGTRFATLGGIEGSLKTWAR